jgi:hypothetical protein
MQISHSSRTWLVRLALAAAVSAVCGVSRAEEPFPAAMQDAAGLDCTPACLLCHTTNPGEAGTWAGKKFGVYMATHGVTKGSGASAVANAYNAYKADPAQAQGAMRLANGQDPDTGLDLCVGPTYGCGAHVAAKTPPNDASALLWIAAAMAVGALVRRTRPRV